MARILKRLFVNNACWSDRVTETDPSFFETLSQQQAPEYLWIGCSDSRVPANDIVGLLPGELFVHRNVANVVVHSDLNCMSVLQFAVEVLKVKHVMVVGHYGCGGVRAALEQQEMGLISQWLRPIKDIATRHATILKPLCGEEAVDRLCELNVIAQVDQVRHSDIVQNAWARGQALSVHGWIYRLRDGRLHDLCVTAYNPAEMIAAGEDPGDPTHGTHT